MNVEWSFDWVVELFFSLGEVIVVMVHLCGCLTEALVIQDFSLHWIRGLVLVVDWLLIGHGKGTGLHIKQ